MTYSECAYKCIRGSGRRQDYEGYKEGSRYFSIHGTPLEPRMGSTCICERLKRWLHLNACSACIKKTSCHTHVHCDNSIPAYQANPASKATIRNQTIRNFSWDYPFPLLKFTRVCSPPDWGYVSLLIPLSMSTVSTPVTTEFTGTTGVSLTCQWRCTSCPGEVAWSRRWRTGSH